MQLGLSFVDAKEVVEAADGDELVVVIFAGFVDALGTQKVAFLALFGRNAEENDAF